MSAQEIIREIQALTPTERSHVARFVIEQDDSWIPDSFKQGMADARAGRLTDMETVLRDAPPPSRSPVK